MTATAGAETTASDAQKSSIERQYASIARQAESAKPPREGFFTSPWLASISFVDPPSSDGIAPLASLEDIDCSRIQPEQIDGYVSRIAQREGFTPDLLRAVIRRESSYLPCAVSSKGAQGLMQLMPETAASLGVSDPFNPHQNIDAGARYLGELLDRYQGDAARALAAYNAGPKRVDQYGGLPPIPETINYVRDILGSIEPPAQ